jgi:hypothetical protein
MRRTDNIDQQGGMHVFHRRPPFALPGGLDLVVGTTIA